MNGVKLNNRFLDEVETFVDKKLTRKEDLSLIIDKYFNQKDLNDLEEFAFTGKYINGLFRVLQAGSNLTDFRNIEQVKKDLNENIEKVTSRLREITLTLNENDKSRLEKNYLAFTKESLQNIRDLTEDLDHIKKYLNYLKRQ